LKLDVEEAGALTGPRPAGTETLERFGKMLIFLTLCTIVVTAILSGSFQRANDWYSMTPMSRAAAIPLILFSFLTAINLTYRAVLVFLYKPFPVKSFTPTLTVVIPAYNEGAMVEKSILSSVEADYPEGKKEVIVVDDGSDDDTWAYIQRAKARYPEVVAIRLERNMGKRHALAVGFEKARGEFIVTMDSDSVIERDGLRALVAPFEDATIGAVTARVRVYNRSDNLVTRMLAVRYAMAFQFFRSSQSVFQTVMCCSGVLSAYRRSVLERIVHPWLNQVFLGERCTYGDDRALTNFILRSGYASVYQSTALVSTIAPPTLKKLSKMLIRWHKSFIRESIIFSRFMFTPYRERNRVLPVVDFTIVSIMFPFQFYTFGYSMYYILHDPLLVFRYLALITLMGLFYMLFYIRFEKSSDFVYGVLYSFLHVFVLMWTIPYAALTMKDGRWLTR
jgi:hyaluronan synthase